MAKHSRFKIFTRRWSLIFFILTLIFLFITIHSGLLSTNKMFKYMIPLVILAGIVFVTLFAYSFKNSRKILCVVISLFMTAGYAFAGYNIGNTLNFFSKITGGEHEPLQAQVTEESFNIYITGLDTWGDISQVSRSDVNIIATVNPVEKKILLTSIPRDYYVEIPGCAPGTKDKLTHTGIDGAGQTVKTVERLTGLAMNYYVKVNYSTLVTMVDEIGGIDVDSDYDFQLQHKAEYTYHKGMNHLDGKRALGFARERYSFPDGDIQRNRNQQKVLKAILSKLTESTTLLTKYNNLLDALGGKIEMNFTPEEIKSVIRMQLDDMVSWDIEQQSIVGDVSQELMPCAAMGGGRASVVLVNEESLNKAVKKIEETASECNQNEE